MTLDEKEIQLVWQKAEIVFGIAPHIYRKDKCGAWIAFNEFGNASSSLGWQIEFLGANEDIDRRTIDDLYPLHCQNYRSKIDGTLVCNVTTDWKQVQHI